LKKAICNVLKIVGIGSILLGLFSCDLLSDNGNFYTLKPVSDAQTLPCQFVVGEKSRHIDGNGNIYIEERVPLNLFGDGVTRMYAAQSGWTPGKDLSSIVFYEATNTINAINQENINTSGFSSHFFCDINNDDTLEVLVAYVSQDTAWLEIISPTDDNRLKQMIAICRDLDDNGYWDGSVSICGSADINNDGWPDILVSTDAGYDSLPRMLVCIDLKNERTLWQFNVSGSLQREHTRILRTLKSEPFSIICGIASKGNGVVTDKMDDNYSYLVALNIDGSLKWIRQTGGLFSTCFFEIGDYNQDGLDEIISALSPEMNIAIDSDSTNETAVFLVFGREGKLIDSISTGKNKAFRAFIKIDLDDDDQPEYMATFTDTTIVIFDHHLQILSECKLYTMGYPVACQDFIGNNQSQLLVATTDNKTWLLDREFAPLAQFNNGLSAYSFFMYPDNSTKNGLHIIAGADKRTTTYHLSIQRTPWFSVFFRKPWLASAFAAIPLIFILGLVILYTLRIRQKNRIINKAKDELETEQKARIVAERVAAQSELVANSWHGFNNVNTTLRVANESLQKYLKDSDRYFKELRQIGIQDPTLSEIMDRADSLFNYALNHKGWSSDQKGPVMDELEEFIDDKYGDGLGDPYELAEKLVNLEQTPDYLKSLLESYQDNTQVILSYLHSRFMAARAQRDIDIASQRNTNLVSTITPDARFKVNRSNYISDDRKVLENLLESLVTSRSDCHDVHLEAKLSPSTAVEINTGYYEEAVTTLVNNAVDAVGYKGNIYIETRIEKDYHVLSVRDEGSGISEENMKRIFDPFFTTKGADLGRLSRGMGLSNLKKLYDRIGGKIEIDTKPGSGTTFTLYTPLKAINGG